MEFHIVLIVVRSRVLKLEILHVVIVVDSGRGAGDAGERRQPLADQFAQAAQDGGQEHGDEDGLDQLGPDEDGQQQLFEGERQETHPEAGQERTLSRLDWNLLQIREIPSIFLSQVSFKSTQETFTLFIAISFLFIISISEFFSVGVTWKTLLENFVPTFALH